VLADLKRLLFTWLIKMQDDHLEDEEIDSYNAEVIVASFKVAAYSAIFSISAYFLAPRLTCFILKKFGVEIDYNLT
jgi:hypothetical protein